MNTRQQLYKYNRIKGMSAYKAAVAAGYSHNTAINAHRNIEKRCNFDDLLKAYGLDDDSILEVLRDGISRTSSNGKPDMVAKCFVEIALKLSGRLKERQEATKGNTTVNVYPSKTIVFQDIDDNEPADINLHEPQGSEGSRVQV